MNLIFDSYLSLLWLFLGSISILISLLIQHWNKTGVKKLSQGKMPKWATRIFGNHLDPYLIFFRMGGLVLAILSIPVGFISNRTGLDIAIWVSFICYYLIPVFFIRKWR